MHDGHILLGFLGALTTAIAVIVYKEYTEEKALKEELSEWVKQGQEGEDRHKAAEKILQCFSLKNDYLSLNYLNLTTLPACIKRLSPHLKRFNCIGNMLSDLPDEMADMKHITTLKISENSKLTTLPNCISQLKNLQTLIAKNCAINNIDTLSSAQGPLEVLELQNNKIESLQPLSHLKMLQELSIYGNDGITEIPKEFNDFDNLSKLSVDPKVKKENPQAFTKIKEHSSTKANDLKSMLKEIPQLKKTIEENSRIEYFIDKLSNTDVFKNNPDKICQNMAQIIQAMQNSEYFNEYCNLCIDEATSSCEDRALFYFTLMAIKKDLPEPSKTSSLEEVFQYAKASVMIEDCIYAGKIKASESKKNNQDDQSEEEIEYALAYLDNIKDMLKITVPDMQFKSYITMQDSDLSAHKTKLCAHQEELTYQKIIDDELLRSLPQIKKVIDHVADRDEFSIDQLDEETSSEYNQRLISLKNELMTAQIEALKSEHKHPTLTETTKQKHHHTKKSDAEKSPKNSIKSSDSIHEEQAPLKPGKHQKRVNFTLFTTISNFFKSLSKINPFKKTNTQEKSTFERIQNFFNKIANLIRRDHNNKPK